MFNGLLFGRKQGGLALDTGDYLILCESRMKVVNGLSPPIHKPKRKIQETLDSQRLLRLGSGHWKG